MTAQANVDALCDEVALLRAQLAATEAENRTLHSIVSARSRAELAGARDRVARIQIGSRERMAMLEHAIEYLDDFVRDVASDDCYDFECQRDANDNDRELCRSCRARKLRDGVAAWRYGGSREEPSRRFVGAMNYRIEDGWNPRETKIHRAWAKQLDDRLLGMILTDWSPGQTEVRDWPTARDWYVATSVVQWLATNVGMGILEAAGFKYTQWDEDRVALDQKREATS